MLDTYVIFDKVEAWQVELGDPIVLDGQHVIVTAISETEDEEGNFEEISLTGISEETGDETSDSLYWSKTVDLWKVQDD